MAEIGVLPVPGERAVLANPTPSELTPEQRDAEAFQATAGDFRKGIRSGFNQMAGGANALVGNLSETLGLTDFAASRFAEAEDYAKFADSVGPAVNDYRQVKDFDTLTQYVAGQLGNAAASFLPAAVGGVAGGVVGGLRGAQVGLAAGSFVPNAGEQAQNIRNLPGSAASKTANAVGVGAINAVLDTASTGRVARQIMKPTSMGLRTAAKELGKTTAIEAGTEGLQDVVGQGGEALLDPSKKLDPHSVINSTLAGAIGGAGLAGAGHAASVLPGAAADAAKSLRDRVKEATNKVEDVPDENDLADVVNNPDLKDSDSILAAIDSKTERARAAVADIAAKVPEAFKDLKDWATDPDQWERAKETARSVVNDLRDHPRTQQAFEAGKRAMDALRGTDEAKKSLGRTAIDANILTAVNERLPESVKRNTTAEQRAEIASWFKHAALYAGARQEVAGPHPGAFSNEDKGAQREQDRATAPVPLPSALLHFGGKDTQATIEAVQEVLRAGGIPVKGLPKVAVAEAATRVRERRAPLERIIHENLKQDVFEDPQARREATEGFMRMLSGRATGEQLTKAAGMLFHDPKGTMDMIDEHLTKGSPQDEFHLSDEELAQFGDQASEDSASGTSDDGISDFQQRRAAEQSFEADKRLRTYDSVEEARQAYRALESEYDPKEVQISHEQEMTYNESTGQMEPTGRITLVAKSRGAADSMSPGQWSRITDKSPARQAGFEHGTITVTRADGKVVRVSLKALTAEAARTMDRAGKGRFKYAHDVVLHGLGMLLGDPNVAKVEEKKGAPLEASRQVVPVTGETATKQGQNMDIGPEQWSIPDETVVGKVNGRDYTWGEIKEMSKLSPAELRIRQITQNPVERAQQAETLDHVEQILEAMQKKAKDLKFDMDNAPGQPRKDYEGSKSYRMAKSRYDRMEGAIERVYEEIDRREREGDHPKMAMGERNVDAEMSDQLVKKVDDEGRGTDSKAREVGLGVRTVDETTGLPLGEGRPRPQGAAFRPDEVGLRPEDQANPGWETTFLRPGEEKMPVTKEKVPAPVNVLSIEDEGKFRAWLAKHPGGTADEWLAKGKPGPRSKKSAASVGATEAISAEKKQEIRDYISQVLGDKAKTFFKNLDHAGEFAHIDGVDVVQIANLALDPFGAARHEAAHGLVQRLMKADKKAAQVLLAAAGSPQVVTRLRALLKGHPEALSQLSDPEERVAYMYQFWAARELTVGPNTKTWFDKVKSFFRTVAGIWSETFIDMDNVEKAGQIFDLFDRGNLSDRNTVEEVLRERMPKTPFERATQVMGPIWKFFDKAFSTSDAYVRGMNIPAFNGVLDQFFAQLGREGNQPGFNQAKHVEANIYLNRVKDAIGEASQEHQREALEALQSNTVPKSADARAIVAAIRPVLRDVFEYMKRSNVKAVVWNDQTNKYDEHDLGFVEHYFPRYYDKSYLLENRRDFEAMLQRHGFSRKDAEAVATNILRDGKRSPDENDFSVGLTYYAPNTQARQLDIPAAELAPYLRKDLFDTMASYVSYAARRAEYAKRFENQGQKIEQAIEQAIQHEGATPEQVAGFRQAVQAWEGSLGHTIDPTLKNIFGALVTYQNVRLLPLALFSSLVDPIGIAVRGGGPTQAFSAFARGIRGLFSESKDEAYELAKTVGSIATAHDAHMIADAYGNNFMGAWQRHINRKFFEWNGMESWNRSMRVAATAAAEKFIIRHATRPNEHSERYLRELGITAEDVKVVDGHLADVEGLKIRGAINLWVDGAVVRPNAHIRPVWMSDPHYMLISHLKQFTYGFQKTIISRVVHEMENGNYTPAYALASYVPFIIAADVMRAALTPGGGDDDAIDKLDLSGVIKRGVQRAGLVGPGQYALDAYGDLGHSKTPLVSFGGPTVQQLYDFGQAAAGYGGSVGQELLKGIPGYVLVK